MLTVGTYKCNEGTNKLLLWLSNFTLQIQFLFEIISEAFTMEANNSSFPTSPGSDLSSKYTKLASEYSKVRAQLGVLKKAVLDEQVKDSKYRFGYLIC